MAYYTRVPTCGINWKPNFKLVEEKKVKFQMVNYSPTINHKIKRYGYQFISCPASLPLYGFLLVSKWHNVSDHESPCELGDLTSSK